MRGWMWPLRARMAEAALLDALAESTEALRQDVGDAHGALAALTATVEAVDAETREQVKTWRREAADRARLAAASDAAPIADSIRLAGPPHRRVNVRRLSVGEPVSAVFDQWMGVTWTADPSPDVLALWTGLLAGEAEASGGLLRAAPSTILDLGAASLARDEPDTVSVTLLDRVPDDSEPVIALPRFTYHRMPRKLRNFGHWLLDFLPQVVALSAVAPQAVFLLPDAMSRFHPSTLGLVGVGSQQMRPWNGSPINGARVLLLLHDGRLGGGRPLSLLRAVHQMFRAAALASPGRRRVYVSRRDAKARRRWLSNEAGVERVFERRGFEIVLMKDLSLDDQIRLFRDVQIVAGTSGAGLSDIVFAAPGTHLIVLHTDRQMRWYADATSRRSTWMRAGRERDVELAELGDSPRFYAHLAAALSQRCHSFLSADEAPLDALASFLDEVLARVETGA